MYRIIRQRQPAKSLKDVDIPDSVWKADFDIVDRYQGFANELMRIDLLTIAGFGFLIKELVVGKDNGLTPHCFGFIITASIFIGLSLIAVLAHRFLSTSCLYYQVIIMRSLKRLENSYWTEDDKANEHKFIAQARKNQTRQSIYSHRILMTAVAFFVISLILMMFVVCSTMLPLIK